MECLLLRTLLQNLFRAINKIDIDTESVKYVILIYDDSRKNSPSFN